jgi:PTS system mannitol-specific IIA component
LEKQGHVKNDYIEKMFERENLVSTYMGNFLAIPHGTDDSKEDVYQTGLAILLYDEPIDWNGNNVRLVIRIAGKGDEHIEILSRIAMICSELKNIEKLLQLNKKEDVLQFFADVN